MTSSLSSATMEQSNLSMHGKSEKASLPHGDEGRGNADLETVLRVASPQRRRAMAAAAAAAAVAAQPANNRSRRSSLHSHSDAQFHSPANGSSEEDDVYESNCDDLGDAELAQMSPEREGVTSPSGLNFARNDLQRGPASTPSLEDGGMFFTASPRRRRSAQWQSESGKSSLQGAPDSQLRAARAAGSGARCAGTTLSFENEVAGTCSPKTRESIGEQSVASVTSLRRMQSAIRPTRDTPESSQGDAEYFNPMQWSAARSSNPMQCLSFAISPTGSYTSSPTERLSLVADARNSTGFPSDITHLMSPTSPSQGAKLQNPISQPSHELGHELDSPETPLERVASEALPPVDELERVPPETPISEYVVKLQAELERCKEKALCEQSRRAQAEQFQALAEERAQELHQEKRLAIEQKGLLLQFLQNLEWQRQQLLNDRAEVDEARRDFLLRQVQAADEHVIKREQEIHNVHTAMQDKEAQFLAREQDLKAREETLAEKETLFTQRQRAREVQSRRRFTGWNFVGLLAVAIAIATSARSYGINASSLMPIRTALADGACRFNLWCIGAARWLSSYMSPLTDALFLDFQSKLRRQMLNA